MAVPKKVVKKVPVKESDDVKTDSETEVAAGGSLGLLLAIMQATGTTLTSQQATALAASMNASATLAASDTQHKTDVNVPEQITSLNGLVFANAVTHAKNVDAINLNALKDNQEANAVNSQRRGDHRDQNHNKQINVDEQVAAVAAMYARFFATLNNPIPPKGE